MEEVKTVINKDQTVATDDGSVVTKRAQSVKTDVNPKQTIANVIWFIYGIIAMLLAFRFILKLASANANNAFVDFIYTISGFFSAPFDSIFGVSTTNAGTSTSVFEPSILVAIAVYALVAWGIARMLTLNEPEE